MPRALAADAKALLRDEELGELSQQHGAIWDIYRWEDTDAILRLLHAVARERDIEITNNPIHDQLFYLDAGLRKVSARVRFGLGLGLDQLFHLDAGLCKVTRAALPTRSRGPHPTPPTSHPSPRTPHPSHLFL